MRDFGEILKSISKNYGFIGWNQGGWFMGLFEHCSQDKANLYLEMLEKRVSEYNKEQLDLQIKYTAGFRNSSTEKLYDVRELIHNTRGSF